MAFEDRVVEFPGRIQLTPVIDDDTGDPIEGLYDMTRAEGDVTTEGTPLNAANLNAEMAASARTAAGAIVGSITVDNSNNVHFKNLQSGTAKAVFTAAKQTVAVQVTFSKAFSKAPRVVATPITSVPAVVSVSVASITTTGFTAYVYRTTKVDTVIHWLAFV